MKSNHNLSFVWFAKNQLTRNLLTQDQQTSIQILLNKPFIHSVLYNHCWEKQGGEKVSIWGQLVKEHPSEFNVKLVTINGKEEHGTYLYIYRNVESIFSLSFSQSQ